MNLGEQVGAELYVGSWHQPDHHLGEGLHIIIASLVLVELVGVLQHHALALLGDDRWCW